MEREQNLNETAVVGGAKVKINKYINNKKIDTNCKFYDINKGEHSGLASHCNFHFDVVSASCGIVFN